MKYIIRNAKHKEVVTVAKLESICFPKEEAGTLSAFEKRLECYPESFFVAENENQVIGYINGPVSDHKKITDEMFEDLSHHRLDGKFQSVFGLGVHPAFRCQGVAAGLMEHLIADARQKGKEGVILTCKDKLISYYEKFGFVNQGVSESVHGGAVWYDMLLEF